MFALWVALTLTFLLPRLMPGDPIGGILQHLSPAQIQSNPGIIQTYEALLGGGNDSIWQDYVIYLHRIAHLDFGDLDLELPGAGLRGRSAGRCPYSIFLVGVAFLLAFVARDDDRDDRRVAARRQPSTTSSCRVFMSLGAFPAFFTALLAVYFLGLKLGWFPIQHAYDNGAHARLQLGVPLERVPPRAAAVLVIVARVHRRLGAEHAHGDDQHDRRGLRGDGAREGPARPARDDALRGPQRDPAAAQRLRRAVRDGGRRRSSSSSSSSAIPAPG